MGTYPCRIIELWICASIRFKPFAETSSSIMRQREKKNSRLMPVHLVSISIVCLCRVRGVETTGRDCSPLLTTRPQISSIDAQRMDFLISRWHRHVWSSTLLQIYPVETNWIAKVPIGITMSFCICKLMFCCRFPLDTDNPVQFLLRSPYVLLFKGGLCTTWNKAKWHCTDGSHEIVSKNKGAGEFVNQKSD